MFDGYYDIKRFRYIGKQLDNSKLFRRKGGEILRKTACFASQDLNVFIDTSDGVNEDLSINEYCARVLKIIEMCNGKKFLFFKSAYSPVKTQKIIELAEENNGTIVPFFKWSFNDNFYQYLVPNRERLQNEMKNAKIKYDIGFFGGLKPYDYPKPNKTDSRLAWQDYNNFGLGSPENTGDFYITARKDLFEILKNQSNFIVDRQVLPYKEYIDHLLKCKTSFNPPGIGEYTSRMFDATFLGKCVVLRKNSYDNGLSWKKHIPEIDFKNKNWPDEYQKIIDNLSEWEEKSLEYYEKCWSPEPVFKYFEDKIKEVI